MLMVVVEAIEEEEVLLRLESNCHNAKAHDRLASVGPTP